MNIKETISNIFKPNYAQYDNVPKIKIYLLRLVFALTFLFVGKASWMHIFTFEGIWEPLPAMSFCVWAAYSTLSVIGIIHPLKMLPLVLFQIFYKVLWLIIVAYPLWETNQLSGSPAEELTYTFLWVVLPIIAVPWKYVFKNYLYKLKRKNQLH